MQKIYLMGVALFTPGITLAHDDALHTASAWYQQPMVVVTVLVVIIALGALGYGLITKKKQLITISAIVVVMVTVTSLISVVPNGESYEPQLMVADFGTGQSVTLYKSPNCGCCSGHAQALEEAGFSVTIEETNDLSAVKQAHNIPTDGESCHTSVIGDYVVEGHVPLEAIEKLLDEKPAIAGIGLAGMPIGTPGMPGPKTTSYEVYQLSNSGEVSSYLTL